MQQAKQQQMKVQPMGRGQAQQQQRHMRVTQTKHTSANNVQNMPSTRLESTAVQLSKETADFQAKIRKESHKIIDFQTRKDAEFQEKERKLHELEACLETQRKNLLEQQRNCEQVSQKYSNEIKQQEDLEKKIQDTREACAILKEYIQNLSASFQLFMNSRNNVVNYQQEVAENYGKIEEEFNVSHSRHIMCIENFNQIRLEKREQQINKENYWKAACNALDQKVLAACNKINTLKMNKKGIEKQLSMIKQQFQEITENKCCVRDELASKHADMKDSLKKMMDENAQLITEKDKLKTIANEYDSFRETYEALVSSSKELDNKICESVSMLNQIEANLNQKEHELKTILEDNAELHKQIESVSSQITDLTKSLQSEVSCVQSLQEEFEKNTVLIQQKEKETATLHDDGEEEIVKLNNALQTEKTSLKVITEKLEECRKHAFNGKQQLQQYTQQIVEMEDQGRRQDEEEENITIKCKELEDSVYQLTQTKEKFESLVAANKAVADEKQGILLKLETRLKETEEETKNQDTECGAKIKDMLSCMEDYKQSYVSRLSILDEENKKASEKVTRLEKTNKELMIGKKIVEEKAAYEQALCTKAESEIHLLENQVLQLKAEIEEQKSKPLKSYGSSLCEQSSNIMDLSGSAKVMTQVPDSPRKMVTRVVASHQKKVTFDDWSEESDESYLEFPVSKPPGKSSQI